MNLLSALTTYFQSNVGLFILLILSAVLFAAAIVAAIVLFVLNKTGKSPRLCKKDAPAENQPPQSEQSEQDKKE